jgi:hypothetical protein
MEDQGRVNEKMKIIMRDVLRKMIPAAFGPNSDAKMRDEIRNAVQDAIEPILLKYNYMVEEESPKSSKIKSFGEYVEEMSTPANVPGMGPITFPGDPGLSGQFTSQTPGSGDLPLQIYKKTKKKRKRNETSI